MVLDSNIDVSVFKNRRKKLLDKIKKDKSVQKNGVLVLFSAFENDRYTFHQDSSFYYFTGVNEPAAVLLLYLDGREVLYIPNYGVNRSQWMTDALSVDHVCAMRLGVSEVRYLGQKCSGYSLSPVCLNPTYETLLLDLSKVLSLEDSNVFGMLGLSAGNLAHTIGFQFLFSNLLGLNSKVRDISSEIFELRREKDLLEVEFIQKAIDTTILAHRGVAKALKHGVMEYEIQAKLEYAFAQNAMIPAFPSIVAGGENATVLHYTKRDKKLRDGDLVIVDIGAECGYYAADITRTYPVSGKFTKRQREIYDIVLMAQDYIKKIAKPGMYLNNPNIEEQSLQHLTRAFFDKLGLLSYFPHGIGHFLGLDVHDVGDTASPLKPGDVFTIEPGIYISEENLGIRIEDDFLVVDGGCRCLSDGLPRTSGEIESMMRS